MDSNLVKGLLFACFFLLGLCGIEHYFKFSRLPHICWVVLFGVGYGILNKILLPGLPPMLLTPEMILYVFLPVLIFDSSRKLDLKLAREVALPSSLLASLGIVASMFLMALPIRWITGLPWVDILFFTAIMSATDPVAVGAVFEQFPIPKKLRTLIEGESLLNDGTTVILFSLMSGRVLQGQELVLGRDVSLFAGSIAGAILLGGLLGWGGALLLKRWKALKDNFIGPLLPILVAYIAFCLARGFLEISGVIAVMASTLVMRIRFRSFKRGEVPTRSEQEFFRGLWEFLGKLANAVLFFMLGAEIGSHYYDINWRVMPGVVAALLFSRSVVVYGFSAAFRLLGIRLSASWQHVLNLGGLKGALSVALILMIPRDYPYRTMFLCAALAMALFTLVANTLGMRLYLKKANLDERRFRP